MEQARAPRIAIRLAVVESGSIPDSLSGRRCGLCGGHGESRGGCVPVKLKLKMPGMEIKEKKGRKPFLGTDISVKSMW